MIRVLIADDSTTARHLITEILNRDPELEVIGAAKDGAEAVEMAKRLKPDILTMDIHMPNLDGFQATERIMSESPTPIVIVSASTMVREVATSMKALRAGALTLLLKPPGPSDPLHSNAAHELIETVKAMADVKVIRRKLAVAPSVPRPVPHEVSEQSHRSIIAIAASTGGPPALQALLGGIPSNFPAPIMVVQHIAHGFTEGFAAWLDSTTPLHVKLAKGGELTQAGTVYIAPEKRQFGVSADKRILITTEPPIAHFQPSADFMFETVARAFRQDSIGVILTGMGEDGVNGLKKIHQEGGHIIAQSKESCVIFGMPGAAVNAEIVDRVLDLDEIASELICRIDEKDLRSGA